MKETENYEVIYTYTQEYKTADSGNYVDKEYRNLIDSIDKLDTLTKNIDSENVKLQKINNLTKEYIEKI